MMAQQNEMRLQRFLSLAGIASRRESETFIKQGMVKVNGRVVTKLGTKVDTSGDRVVVKRQIVRIPNQKTYVLFNKPKGYLTSRKDRFGRKVIYDLLPKRFESLKYAGRLDYVSEGLLLLTDDGELINRLSHPRYKVEKTYEVYVEGVPTPANLGRLRKGIHLDTEKTLPCKIKILEKLGAGTRLEVRLREGRKRQLRRMFESIGHSVFDLKRTAIVFLKCEGIKLGGCRDLTSSEIAKLRKSVGYG